MLLTPRTYQLAQRPDLGRTRPAPAYFLCATQSRTQRDQEQRRARRMLLLHQTGSVKVGEVVRCVGRGSGSGALWAVRTAC
jgi:hypothetical protein